MENIRDKADTYRILADGKFMNNNTHATNRNNNDLIIGPTGAGKTRSYVIPNILQCNESMIITDTKNSIYSQVRPILEQKGYKVIKINLADCEKSPCGYNPLKYIRRDRRKYSQQDILILSAALIPIESQHDPFWEYSARICLESVISYVLETLPQNEHNLSSVVRLAGELGRKGRYKNLMSELEILDPDSFALSRYRMFKSVSEDSDRTFSCIISFIMSKISPFAFDGAKKLFTNPETINIKELGRHKTAVFLTISDTDTSMYRLANIFYMQALHTLCDLADKLPGHRLPVPVRIFLDDFASNTEISDFDKVISVIRSREISVSVILQSVSQLESIYGHSKAMTIINNCDNLLCLGCGRDIETAKYISHQVNKPVSTILNTPLDDAWLLTRGRKAEQVKKYELKNHRFYDALPEAKQLKKSVKETQPENCI